MAPELSSWVTWALQGLVLAGCVIIWKRLEQNTEAIHKIEILLPEAYIKKDDFNGFRSYHSEKTNHVENRISRLELREAERTGQEMGSRNDLK